MTLHTPHRTSKNPEKIASTVEDGEISATDTEMIKKDAHEIPHTSEKIEEHQKKRKRKSLRKSAHKSWKDWAVRLGTSARVLSFLALLMVLSMWSESVEYSKTNNLLQGSIASIDMSDEGGAKISEQDAQTDIQVTIGAAGSDLLDMSLTKSPKGLQKMEISIVYDTNVHTIGGALTTLPGCQSSTQDIVPGLVKVQLECNKSLDIARGKTLLSIPVTKQKTESTSVINMVEASFSTKDQTTYKLSTPSITH